MDDGITLSLLINHSSYLTVSSITVKDTAAAIARCRSSSIGFGSGYPARSDIDPRGTFSRTRSFPRPEGLKAINTNLPLSSMHVKGGSADRDSLPLPRALVTSPVRYNKLPSFLSYPILSFLFLFSSASPSSCIEYFSIFAIALPKSTSVQFSTTSLFTSL